VIANLRAITAEHALIASRLPALFLTLARNVQWWTRGPLLSYGQRVDSRARSWCGSSTRTGDPAPGAGELRGGGRVLHGGPGAYGQLKSLLGELIPLAVHRGGGLAWEYYFSFDGGSPPWVSAMARAPAGKL